MALKPVIDRLRQVFKIRSDGWGIYWSDWEKRTVCGHDGRPKQGDVFTSKMHSGKIAVFEVLEVRWCLDPPNMYFADVKEVGYWEMPS